jgi:hypothetical protein
MDKILEALKNLLPESDVSEVSESVSQLFEQAKEELESEYNAKLEEAYTELSKELAQAEKTAEEGYEEAYAIIGDLRNRLEVQGEEYKEALEEGYEEAYQMLKAEQEKNHQLEVELYEEYDRKLAEMKEYIVDKVDQFLQFKGQEIYEQARRDVVNDPRMAEHKVALDRIIDITSGYMSDADFSNVTSSKLQEAQKSIEDVKGQLRILEARNIRLSTENTKLNEAVRRAEEVINESQKVLTKEKKSQVINEQKERAEKASNVTGRGNKSQDAVVLSEYAATKTGTDDQLLILSGLKKSQ